MFLAKHVSGQCRPLIIIMPCQVEAPASHSQHVGRCSSLVSHGKRFHHGCFNRLDSNSYVIATFKLLAASRCVVLTRVLFLSQSGGSGSNLSI